MVEGFFVLGVFWVRGPPLHIEWQETAEELGERYRQEQHLERRMRLHGLWMVRQGKNLRETARLLGVNERTVRRWVRWYRQGGIEAVRSHLTGGRQGRANLLSREQQANLVEQAAQGVFHTIGEAMQWMEKSFGVCYSYTGVRSLCKRLGLKKKVPRPIAAKASLEAQEAWKKGAWRTG